MLFMSLLFSYLCVCHAFALLIAALWSPEGKGLTSWLLFVVFVVILLLSHLVSWDRCDTCTYQIVSIPGPCCLSYFKTFALSLFEWLLN